MDTGSYKFKTLCQKYEDFRGPAFDITVDGTKLESFRIPLTVDVEQCADGSAGGCHFQIENLYDYEQSEWLNNLAKTLDVGAELKVEGGYVKKKLLFYGYVDEVSVQYSGSAPPSISVSGMDGLCYLMSCREPIYGGKLEPKKVVTSILEKAKSAGFATSITVGNLPDFDSLDVKEKIDDFKYLRLLADRYCMNLMALNGELIFDELLSNTKSLIQLTVGSGLLEFQKRVSLQNQVGEVEIRGTDVNNEQIKGTASTVSIRGTGKTAAQAAPKFKKTLLREENAYVRTVDECKKVAQAKLDRLALNYVSGSGLCLGLPELIPGRFITIEGLDGETVGDYFITKVRHQFGSGGYLTQFEVKGAKD